MAFARHSFWKTYRESASLARHQRISHFVRIGPVCECRFILFCMDSLNKQKAVHSHQSKVTTAAPRANKFKLNVNFPSKVVSEAHNNKTITSSNQAIIAGLKASQSDLKDTNFEYEDNEWDIGKCSARINLINSSRLVNFLNSQELEI